jgi:hypothetical protein
MQGFSSGSAMIHGRRGASGRPRELNNKNNKITIRRLARALSRFPTRGLTASLLDAAASAACRVKGGRAGVTRHSCPQLAACASNLPSGHTMTAKDINLYSKLVG